MLQQMIPDEIIKYIDSHWKPNQDDNYVMVEKNSKHYHTLHEAFEYYFNLSPDERAENKFNVGPFIGIVPYGQFDVEDDPTKIEFLFEYDDIDRSQLKKQHLTIF